MVDFNVAYCEWLSRIFKMVGDYNIQGYDDDDLAQELSIVFWKCCEKYDEGKGYQFSTYFYTCARNKLASLVASSKTDKRKASLVSNENIGLENAAVDIFSSIQYKLEVEDFVGLDLSGAIHYIIDGGDIRPRDIDKVVKKNLKKGLTAYYRGAENGSILR